MNHLQLWIFISGWFYLHHLARWERRRGHYTFARLQKLVHLRCYDQVEVLAGNLSRHPHCSSSMRAAALRYRAWGRICRGRLKEARDDVAQALALSGRYQESLARFRAAGEENPRFALGIFLLSAGRSEESLFWLNRAVEEQPARRPADYNLYSELTEFGRNHLAGRKVAGELAQRN